MVPNHAASFACAPVRGAGGVGNRATRSTMGRMFPVTVLEDELGDVLEKALKLAGVREDELARRSGVDVNRIKDVLDYRYDLAPSELAAIARALELNEAGIHALAASRYPTPELRELPFRLDVLAMPYGVGVVNAYLVRPTIGDAAALLIDSGHCADALERAWPNDAQRLDAGQTPRLPGRAE